MDNRQAKIDATRRLLNWLEQRPAVPLPFQLDGERQWSIYVFGKESKTTMAMIARQGGKWEKRICGDDFLIIQDFGHGIQLAVNADQENICTRVLESSEVVPAHTIPAKAEQHIDEYVKEVFAWKCPDSILKGNGHDSDSDSRQPAGERTTDAGGVGAV